MSSWKMPFNFLPAAQGKAGGGWLGEVPASLAPWVAGAVCDKPWQQLSDLELPGSPRL